MLAPTPTGNPGSTPGLGYLKLLSSNLMTNKIQMFETEIKLSSRKICPGPGSYSLDLDLSRDRSRIFDLQSVLSSSLFSLDQNIIIDLLTYYKILHHRFLHVFRIIVFFSVQCRNPVKLQFINRDPQAKTILYICAHARRLIANALHY